MKAMRLLPGTWALACAVLLSLAGCGGDLPPGQVGVPGHFPTANLLIISLDTLRADDVGTYGGPPGISPSLDRFAAESVVFEQARSVSPHTAPSHMSLFTSRMPSEHGVHNVAAAIEGARGTVLEVGEERFLVSPLPSEIPTLAEVLSFLGFETVAFTDGGNVSPIHGFGRGFDRYTAQLNGESDNTGEALDWLAAYARGDVSHPANPDKIRPPRSERFFMFWHTYQIHSPYTPPAEYIERFAPADYQGPLRQRVAEISAGTVQDMAKGNDLNFWDGKNDFTQADADFLRGVYRGGVLQGDDLFGGLLEGLEAAGVLDSTIVVVLSDHGEEFREHGGFGHRMVYEESLHVPLIVRLPGGAGGGRRVTTRVSLMDVLPTVLELLDVTDDVIERLDPGGRSLADVITAGGEPARRPLSAEMRMLRADHRDWEWRGAHWIEDTKFIWLDHRKVGEDAWVDAGRQFFDLASDPGEQHDLARTPVGKQDPRLARLTDWHAEWVEQMAARAGKLPAGAAELSKEQLEQLRRLGYVDG